MADERVERRLAAVLAADVTGYSRLMGADEEGTLARLKAARKASVDPAIASHRGRIVKTTGDGMLVEFASAVDAARCSVEVQRAMAAQNAGVPQDVRIEFRIGVHVGDIIIDDNDIFGDGVNIAARLEGIAEPGGVCISDDAYRQIRGKVEIGWDDLGPQTLKNIAEPMRAWRVQLGGQSAAKAQPSSPVGKTPVLALPDNPSIAVLPFQNMSGDPEQEYFADGMVEDIITALSRFKELFVIARTSSFTYKGKTVDVRQIGRELGVRYVLEGSVRKAGGRVRITGQLVDASSGLQVWTDRFEGAHEEIFDLQDRIASAVVTAVAPKVEQAEMNLAKKKATDSLDAYDCLMRATASAYRWTRKDIEEAERFLDRSIKIDPEFATAYGVATWCIAWRLINGWSDDLVKDSGRCGALARRAVELAKDDAAVLAWAGYSLALVVGELDEGMALLDRAVALNPNLARAWTMSAVVNIFVGNPEIAIERTERAMRLSPRDTAFHLIMHTCARACFYAGRYDEAVGWSTKAMQESPHGHDQSLIHLIASYALTQRQTEAEAALALHQQISSQTRLSQLWQLTRLRRPDDIARLKEGLRIAGMPE